MILITNGISICEAILNHHGKTIMKNKSMLAALAVLLMTSDVRAATCPETLSRVIGPDFTCVSLTDRLLVSLEGATEAEVIQAMKANGRLLDDHDTVLHFMSIGRHGARRVGLYGCLVAQSATRFRGYPAQVMPPM